MLVGAPSERGAIGRVPAAIAPGILTASRRDLWGRSAGATLRLLFGLAPILDPLPAHEQRVARSWVKIAVG